MVSTKHAAKRILRCATILTVPLARVVAQYQNELPRFFRRYQIQPVWRADRPAKGRFREFFQCDIDTLGTKSPVVEVEQLTAVTEVLTKLGFKDFRIRINHRQVLAALLTNTGVSAEQQAGALVELDKLDKIGWDGVAKALTERGVTEDSCNRLHNWIGAAQPGDWLDWLEQQFPILDAPARAGFDNLRDIKRLLEDSAAAERLRIDPSLARGLSYYTGAIMEIAVPDLPGSLGGGGRYDDLIGMFLGRNVPACGFSLGLERIIVVMTERNMFPPAVARPPTQVMVTFMTEDLRADALKLAAELRAEELSVEIFPDPSRKLEKPLKYARERSVSVLAILGEDERARGEVSVKDLRDRHQESPARAAVVAWISNRLSNGTLQAPKHPSTEAP